MDVVAMLVDKVTAREKQGWLPINEKGSPQFAPSPPGSNYPPLRGEVATGAAIVLYEYFDGRWAYGDPEGKKRVLQPFEAQVIAAWKAGRNMRSSRLLAILADEWIHNMNHYWADLDSTIRCEYALMAAERLGIENDWPHLIPQPEYAGIETGPNMSSIYPSFETKFLYKTRPYGPDRCRTRSTQ